MKAKTLIICAASCVSLLAGCSQQTTRNDALTVHPNQVAKTRWGNPQAWYDLGRYYQGQGRHALAVPALENAVAADGAFVEARNRLGVSYALLGRHEEAIGQLEAAAQAAPNAAHVYSNLGYAHYLKGDYAEAASALQRAVALDPANRHAQQNLGLAYARLGETAKSNEAYARATAPQPKMAVATPSQPAPAVQESRRTQVVQVAPNVYELRPKPASTAVVVMSADRPSIPPAQVEASDGNGVTGMAGRAGDARLGETAKAHDVYAKDAAPQPETAPKPGAAPEASNRIEHMSPNVYEPRLRHASFATAIPANRPSAPRARVEVSNGNGVTGMAKRVGVYLKDGGIAATRLTNQRGFNVAATRVEYRKGYEAEARQVAAAMPRSVDIAPSTRLRRDVGVRLVLGKDMTGNLGYFENGSGSTRLARNGR